MVAWDDTVLELNILQKKVAEMMDRIDKVDNNDKQAWK
jgi:hypothetical protein